MPTKDELKTMACREIDRRKDEIIKTALDILENPETGFRELKTSRIVKEKFNEWGITPKDRLALTGVKDTSGAGEGPAVAILGELDSLIVPDHPKADIITGAAHACGHHAQIGMLIGAAAAFPLIPVSCPIFAGKWFSWQSRQKNISKSIFEMVFEKKGKFLIWPASKS